MKKKIKSGAMDLLAFIVGGGLYAISVNYFTAPNQIAPGGATGVATILNFLFQWPIGTVILILNLPLFIWGLIQHGFRFLSKTIFATVISTIIIDASAPFIHGYSGDKILAALFGDLAVIPDEFGIACYCRCAANLERRNFYIFVVRIVN